MMEEQKNIETFQYTYSAKEQKEIQSIRKKYTAPDAPENTAESKLEQLRRLDQSVAQKATAVSLALGIIGTLLMGVGMCCVLVWMGIWFIPGIVIGIAGIGIAALSYPLYARILQKERARVAPEILRLTDELLK